MCVCKNITVTIPITDVKTGRKGDENSTSKVIDSVNSPVDSREDGEVYRFTLRLYKENILTIQVRVIRLAIKMR